MKKSRFPQHKVYYLQSSLSSYLHKYENNLRGLFKTDSKQYPGRCSNAFNEQIPHIVLLTLLTLKKYTYSSIKQILIQDKPFYLSSYFINELKILEDGSVWNQFLKKMINFVVIRKPKIVECSNLYHLTGNNGDKILMVCDIVTLNIALRKKIKATFP